MIKTRPWYAPEGCINRACHWGDVFCYNWVEFDDWFAGGWMSPEQKRLLDDLPFSEDII